MEIERREQDGAAIISLSGELDAGSLPEVSEAVARIIDQGRNRLVLNVKDVAFVTSSVVGYLITAANHLKQEGGALAISSPPSWLARNLETLGITDRLRMFADDDAALAWLGEDASSGE